MFVWVGFFVCVVGVFWVWLVGFGFVGLVCFGDLFVWVFWVVVVVVFGGGFLAGMEKKKELKF